ncbi:hypothetical protein CANARDRAFT_200068 [[Candida] arabinofermentans NRRL YB-2248]|uniref:polynucleotide adenylyltransferase n=1 Tax=[Candida] arabinofermentans NRRL YB-2248 TaxID=983967 RepID=A0A1E4SYR8_9ASCO|nr:hypothetical protein CANARDRAFT_200068 [[Candida] arabinofermentans NRRL YB-2248]
MAGNSLTDNSDFIAFDFSSDEEEKKTKYDNDESGYHTKSTTHKTGESNSKYPWIRNNDHSRQIEISDWLTMEIKDFINYISPSAEEIQARNGLVKKLRQSITSLWPDAELYCFGSFATDLYLPGSDIDMVIVSKRRNGKYDNKSSLYQLSSFLRTRGLGVNIEPIAKAKVPIIKFVDPTTGIHIDISFERVNGIKAAELIVSWINETPGLRELVMIVKQFLSVRKLNVVHTGGLGGFAIICLVRSFLKLHPRVVTGSIDPLANLGVLLIEFFELYGYNFGYDSTAIAFNDKGDAMYVTKHSNPALQGRNPFLLAIQDPHDPSNNISRGTHNLRDIKRAFGGAFELLANKCYDMYNASYKERLGQSILGDIIKYKGKQRDFEDARETVTNHAYLAASSGSSKSGTLPPLPSEGKRGKLHEDFQFYSDLSDSEDELSKLQAVYEKSQESSSKATKERSIKVDQLMGIQDNEDADDSYDPTQLTKTAVQDFSDSDDDDTKSQAKKNGPKVDERNKRDYWLMKGSSF